MTRHAAPSVVLRESRPEWSVADSLVGLRSSTLPPFERVYTVRELAAAWSLSPCTVRSLFAREEGTLVLALRRPGKRRYRTLRIPHSVAVRVYRRLLTPE